MNAHTSSTATAAARVRGLCSFPGSTAHHGDGPACSTRKAMHRDALFARYEELRAYVGWTEADAAQVRSIGPRLEADFDAVVDDFYEEIDRHPGARKVLTGGDTQVKRLKTTLRRWLGDLFEG